MNHRDDVAAQFDKLCVWAANLRLEDIPAPTLATAALILGDNIAATLSAQDEPEIRAWHDRTIAQRTSMQSTIWRAGGPRVSLAEAAVSNGLAVTWDELDDGYTRTAIHPGALSQPLIVAAAEADGATLATMFRAIVGAYEIGTRFARTWPGTLPRIHPHAAFNTICAAAGIALVRNADAPTLARTLSAAVTMTMPGPYSHPIEGALVRNAWPAAGAWLGLFAYDLARTGISGLSASPYDVFTTCFGAEPQANELAVNLGDEWTITAGYHKLYAACHHSHAAMEALETIFAAHPELRSSDRIENVTVEGSKMAMNFANTEPTTTLGAKFSIPHAVAGTVAYRANDPHIFTTAGLTDTRIVRFRSAIRLEPLIDVGAWPYDRPARVTIRLNDGTTFSERCDAALGSPARPLDADTVIDKIGRLSEKRVPRLRDAIVNLREAIITQGPRSALPPTVAPWMQDVFSGGNGAA